MRKIVVSLFITSLGFCSTSIGLAQSLLDMNDDVALCAAGKMLAHSRLLALDEQAGKRASNASTDFDATYYHLDLDVDPSQSPRIQGSVSVHGRALSTLTSLALDFSTAMNVAQVTTLDGDPLLFTHGANVLTIELQSPVPVGDGVEVVVEYWGDPESGDFNWGNLAWNGDPYLWTLSEPYGAMDWWPNKDHPADKADSVRVTILLDSDLRVGSNGLLVGEIDHGNGTTTYDWLHKYPISTYLVSLAVGRYDVNEQIYERPDSLVEEFGPLSLPILHYGYRDRGAYEGISDQSGWKRVTEVLPVFEYWYGPYPFPEEKYGHAHFTRRGGMEHQTMTSMGNIGLGLVSHELAHMWYGDAVTNKTWPHLWLHEGFATQGAMLFWESDPNRFQATYNSLFDSRYDSAKRATGTLVLSDTSSVGYMFDGRRVYHKGWMVLRMLRGMVGDDTFRYILRAFAADENLRYGVAVTADFQAIAERESGRDLSAFFDQWITNGTGYPVYGLEWKNRWDPDGYAIDVDIRQWQNPDESNVTAFEMPIELVVETEAGFERFTVENTQRHQSYVLHLQARPIAIEFDPDRWILRDVNVMMGTDVVTPTLPAAFEWSVYPNPATDGFTLEINLDSPENVQLRLLDSEGRLASTLADRFLPSGLHRLYFDLPDGLASGSYRVEIRTDTRTDHRGLVVIR